MKIVVVSDTHGYNEKLWEVIERESPFDMLIHCGDIECEPYVIRDRVDCALMMVAGNNDYDPDLERVKVFDLGSHRALLTHGHRYKVHYGLESLYYLAQENQANIVFFGHTHVPCIQTDDGVTFINPGSLTYPRQIGRESTYVVMTLDGSDNPKYETKKV